MFDPLPCWPDTLGNQRVVDPPLAVVVDLGSLFPPAGRRADQLPMRVSRGGLDLTGYRPGELLAWARSRTGDWIGLVRFTAEPANHQGHVRMLQWVPALAVRPASAP